MKETSTRPKGIKETQDKSYSLPPLELLRREAPSTTSSEDNSNQADRIIGEFSRRGVNVILNEIVTASRLTTFLFAFEDGERDQVRRIDESMRIMLEMALETSGVTLQVPLPDSSLFAVHVYDCHEYRWL